MHRSSVLRAIFLSVGVLLSLAWFGASHAAGKLAPVDGEMTAAEEEELVLIKSDEDSVILELRTPAVEIDETYVDGVAYHVMSIPRYGQTDDVGRPQLPLKGTLLAVPPSAEYSLRILEVEEEIIPGRYNVYPVPQPVPRWDEAGDLDYVGQEFTKDESVYSRSSYYPAGVAEIGSAAFIRDQKVVQLRLFPIQYNPASGELRHYRRIRVELSFSYPRGRFVLAGAWDQSDPFNEVLQHALLNYDSGRNWRVSSSAATGSGAPRLGQGGSSYKVFVDEDGMYRLTYADLQGAGIDVDNVDPHTFKLENQGHELAIRVVGEGDNSFDSDDYILFYGEQVTTRYTYTNVYWLTEGGSNVLRMPERDGTLGAGTVLTYFQTTRRWEEDNEYRTTMPRPTVIPSEEELDHWFGIWAVAPSTPSVELEVDLHNLAVSPPQYSATVRGYLHGGSQFDASPDHHSKVYLNGYLLDEAKWDGLVPYQFQEDVSQSHLVDGTNVVSVECPLELPVTVTYDLVYVDSFEIDYYRAYTTENDSLLFDGDGAGTWQYEVGGFTTDTLEVFDITDPLSVTRMVSTTVVESGSYSLKYEDTIGGERHYFALAPYHYKSPPPILEDTPSSLADTSNRADYIIITHSDFRDAVMPLRDHREGQGLGTLVADIQDVYDEFSYGIFDPRAIRDFLRYAYDNWVAPPPSYVLLVGDGNYDFKNHLGRDEPNYVPPYLIYADEWVGETAADNRYACVAGDDILADMQIGRLPAQTAAHASAMVAKIISYEQSPPGGNWMQKVLFVADDPDEAGDFRALSDDLADNHLLAEPLYSAEKVYYGVSPYNLASDVKCAITSALETGRLFINYAGHGALHKWGGYPHDPFLEIDDVASLPTSQKYPVMLPAACKEGYFISPSSPDYDRSSMGETVVRVEGKGALASWSPTSGGEAAGQHYLQEGFYNAFKRGVHELGPATYLGKLNLYQNAEGDHWELIDTYVLFGDPALQLPTEHQHWAFMPMAVKAY